MLYGHKVYGAKFYSLIIYYTIGPFFFWFHLLSLRLICRMVTSMAMVKFILAKNARIKQTSHVHITQS